MLVCREVGRASVSLDWDCSDALITDAPPGEKAAARKKASEVVDAFHLEKREQESLAWKVGSSRNSPQRHFSRARTSLHCAHQISKRRQDCVCLLRQQERLERSSERS